MATKLEGEDKYIKAALDAIKGATSLRDLYVAIHGVDPSRQEFQRFSNRLNPARSNPGADMLGLCIEHLPQLHNMSVGEFFGITDKGDEE